MKKLLIASMLLAFLAGCKDDDPIITEPGSTLNINLRQEQNSLLFTGYQLKNNQTLPLVQKRIRLEGEFGNRLNHISFLPSSSDFYSPIGDSILNQGIPPSFPYFMLNGLPVVDVNDYTSLRKSVALSVFEKPIASVGHVVFRDDTSWVVSSKVEFFEDTLVQPEAIKIETYMLANIEAKLFLPPVNEDYKFNNEKNVVTNNPLASTWAKNIPNKDTTGFLVNIGDPIVNEYLLVGNSNPKDGFGTPLSEYWPFSGNYTEGDIIGTNSTPIRHHFPKLKAKDFAFDRKVSFVTVIWAYNPLTNVYDYVNSYSTGKFYTD